MNKYYLMDKKEHTVLEEISFEEYKVCKRFYKKYKLLENLQHSFFCGNDAVRDFKSLVKQSEEEKLNADINKIHTLGIYHSTSMIIMLRLFIDNAKSYRKQIGYHESAQTINKTENIYEVKLLKALRNYAQHFSIPISNTRLSYSFTEDKSNLKFSIKKDELLLNKHNKYDIETINAYENNEISFNDLVDIWEEENQKLFTELVIDFSKNIEFKMKKVFNNHFGIVESKGKQYHTNAIVTLEGKHQFTKEFLVMDEMLIQLILVAINNIDK